MNPINLLITGVSSDIGRELALKVVQNGSSVLLVTSNHSEFTYNRDSLVTYLPGLDLTVEHSTALVSEYAEKLFDTPFCWLHAVGDFWYHKSIENTSLNEAISLINSHYITLYAVSKALIPVMKKVGGGRILAFSCNSVKYNYPNMAAFSSAKAAVECFIRCIANEYIQYNILANCLALPTIATIKVKESKGKKYHPYYIETDKLVDTIIDIFTIMSPFITGNAINLLKYSPYFYSEGYYTRNNCT